MEVHDEFELAQAQMSLKVIAPIAIASGASYIGYLKISIAVWGSHTVGKLATSWALQVLDYIEDQVEAVGQLAFYIGCFLLFYELRCELLTVVKFLFRVAVYILSLKEGSDLICIESSAGSPFVGRDHVEFTCYQMAAAAVEGFLLLERAGEWDEVWSAGVVPGSTELLARTTNTDGTSWIWTLVQVVSAAIRFPTGAGNARTAPAGVPGGSINWICAPESLDQKWSPTPAEVLSLKQEAQLLALHVSRQGLRNMAMTVPGSGGDVQELQLGPVAPGGALVQPAPGGAGALGPAVGGDAPA